MPEAKTGKAPCHTRWLPSLLALSIPQANQRSSKFLQKSKIENAMPPVNDNDNSDSSSAVQVAVRVRPMLALEHGNSECLQVHSSSNQIQIGKKSFTYDFAMDQETNQLEMGPR